MARPKKECLELNNAEISNAEATQNTFIQWGSNDKFLNNQLGERQ